MSEIIYWTGNLAIDRGEGVPKAQLSAKHLEARAAANNAWSLYALGKVELVQRQIVDGVYDYIMQPRKKVKRPFIW